MLSVENLRIHFHNAEPGHDAVKGVSFTVPTGEIVGLVGESGSGKTVTAMAITGLLQRRKAEISGKILLDGNDMISLNRDQLRELQGKEIGVVFQEVMSANDPCMKIGHQVEETLLMHEKLSAAERKAKVLQALADADLPNPEEVYDKYPHQLSGGMLQRAMIAAAIISRPSLLVCDEPTTALDVTIQGQILDLLKNINKKWGTTILFISHDLNIVRKLCTEVLVMYKGELVEQGSPEEIFQNPQQDYTRRLIAAIPSRTHRIRDDYVKKEES